MPDAHRRALLSALILASGCGRDWTVPDRDQLDTGAESDANETDLPTDAEAVETVDGATSDGGAGADQDSAILDAGENGQCASGYVRSGTGCADIDECAEKTHTCHMTSTCQNRMGDFECVCPVGFSGGTQDGVACAPRIVTGLKHACSLHASGRVMCWGANDKGQLGDRSSDAYKATPVEVVGLANVIAISAADSNTTCALLSDRTVRCWGDNSTSQLGDGSSTPRVGIVQVADLADVISLSVSMYGACAVVRNGTTSCWGTTGLGAFSTPTPSSAIPTATSVASGMAHACVITPAGGLWCWGRNVEGQLGAGDKDPRTAPVAVSGAEKILWAAAGFQQTTAIRSDGQLLFWGGGSIKTEAAPRFSDTVTAAASIYDTCAVQRSGKVTCWVGVPGAYSASEWTLDTGQIAALALHGDYVWGCAVNQAGYVLCWGKNESGQLGNGTTTDTTYAQTGVFQTVFVNHSKLW